MALLHAVSDQGEEETDRQPVATNAEQSRGIRSGSPPPSATTPAQPHSGGSLTRVTANFTPRAMAALEQIANRTGDSKTDILNTSVMVMDVLLEMLERSGGVLHVIYPGGTEEHLRFVR
jgi:hypothetical protein